MAISGLLYDIFLTFQVKGETKVTSMTPKNIKWIEYNAMRYAQSSGSYEGSFKLIVIGWEWELNSMRSNLPFSSSVLSGSKSHVGGGCPHKQWSMWFNSMQSEKDKSWWDIKIININHEYTKAYRMKVIERLKFLINSE